MRKTSPNMIYKLVYTKAYLYLVPTAIDPSKSAYVPWRIRNYFKQFAYEITGEYPHGQFGVYNVGLVWNANKTAKLYIAKPAFQFPHNPEILNELLLWDKAGKEYLASLIEAMSPQDRERLKLAKCIARAEEKIAWFFNDLKFSIKAQNYTCVRKNSNFEEDCNLYEKTATKVMQDYIRAALGAGQ